MSLSGDLNMQPWAFDVCALKSLLDMNAHTPGLLEAPLPELYIGS